MKNSALLTLIAIQLLGCASKEAAPNSKATDTVVVDSNLPAIVQKTLGYHDPKGLFDNTAIRCRIRSTMANDTAVQERMVSFHTQEGAFLMMQEQEGKQETYQLPVPDGVTDSTQIARSKRARNYFRYMIGGANVLADPDALISDQVKDTVFEGSPAKEISVQYQPIGETPHWYFIVDATGGKMLQSRFIYHEGEENQRGEFINYGPYVDYQGMKLTTQIVWHYLNGDLLATEKIEYLGNTSL